MQNVLQFPDRARGFVPQRLAEARAARQMSRAELARDLGLTGQAIGYYETGERRPDMDILLRISAILEQPVSFFLRAAPSIDGIKGVRYFRSVGPKSNKLNYALDIKTKWLWELVQYLQNFVRFPQPNLPPFVDGPASGFYTLQEIEEIATRLRRHWSMGDGPIANMVALLETNGVIVSRLELGTDSVDAFSCWIDGRPYILLGSDKGSCARSRFDAAHELGHLLLHRDISEEDLENKQTRDRIEAEANLFAGAFLLPRTSMLTEFYSTRMTHLVGLKRRWKVSMQAIAHRCRAIGAIDETQYILFRKQMSASKMLKKEPLDGEEMPLEQPGILLKSWRMLLEKNIVQEVGIENEVGFSLENIQRLCGQLPSLSAQPPTGKPMIKRIHSE